jgi:hypothetical protein
LRAGTKWKKEQNMPINATHPDYDFTLPEWIRARDVLAGEDAVKSGGEKYLPRLDSQTEDEYCAYRKRAAFFNGTARTADGYVGLIFRRPPLLVVGEVQGAKVTVQSLDQNVVTRIPGAEGRVSRVESQTRRGKGPASRPAAGVGRALADFANDADMRGTSLIGYAKNVLSEVVSVGRAGTLIDWESEFEDRVYASMYGAEDVLNWQVGRVGGRTVPVMVALRETAVKNPNGEFRNPKEARNSKPQPQGGKGQVRVSSPRLLQSEGEGGSERGMVEQIRVLKLVPGKGASGATPWQCVVEIWQELGEGKNKHWILVDTRVPLRRGKALPSIPFVFHGPRHSLPAIDKLPLADIIAVNLDHYRLDADYKHGLHFTALPTAWVSGFDKSATLRIGSGASAGFLEFTGQGLSTFERAMDRDERLMAVLGSRLLENQKRVGETAEAIQLRQSGENSILSAVATSVSESLTQVLRWAYWWNSTEALPHDVTDSQALVQLNTDFSLQGMTSQDLQAVVAAWQSGAISQDTMFELFRRGEILPDGRTNQDEAALIGKTGKGNS